MLSVVWILRIYKCIILFSDFYCYCFDFFVFALILIWGGLCQILILLKYNMHGSYSSGLAFCVSWKTILTVLNYNENYLLWKIMTVMLAVEAWRFLENFIWMFFIYFSPPSLCYLSPHPRYITSLLSKAPGWLWSGCARCGPDLGQNVSPAPVWLSCVGETAV